MNKVLLPAIMLLGFGCLPQAQAQDFAVKTNLVADALLNVNLGVEAKVAPKWSVDVTGELNLWTLSHGRRWKHWYVMPEGRYWLCDAFNGHFVALNAIAGQYNVGGFNGGWNFLGTDARKLSEFRYQGWMAGAGIGYGYSWPLSTHWNLEAEIGIGWSYTKYDQYKCSKCGKKLKSGETHNYVGPTKAAVNVSYVF